MRISILVAKKGLVTTVKKYNELETIIFKPNVEKL